MYSTLSKPLPRGAGRRTLVVIAALVMLTSCAQSAEKKADSTSDEDAIRATVESYVAAYNCGDAKAVAAHWSDSGEWTSPAGQRFRGKQAIEKELETMLAENKGVHIEVMHPTIRLVSPEVAVEEGTVRVVRPAEAPDDSTYLAIHVKKDRQWKLDSVHETSVSEEPAASAPLQDLAWLVGEWTDDSPEANVAATVTWTKNKAFLTYGFKASAPGMDDLEGTQVIGWDPAADTIRSWMFDSDGGFGEGTWSRKGNSWVVKFSQVLPDGRKASATNIYTLVDGNTVTWKSIGRKVDEDLLPNVEEVKLVRKSAGDVVKETAKAAEKPPAGDEQK
jgi:uncharacterized protein (TIGR02246 family)